MGVTSSILPILRPIDKLSMSFTSSQFTESCQGSESGLSTGTGGLGVSTTSSSDLDVDSVDSEFVESLDDISGGHHSGVGRGFFSIGLDLHTTGDSAVGVSTGYISDVEESIVPGGEDVSDTEDEFVFADLRAQLNNLFTGTFFVITLLSLTLLGDSLDSGSFSLNFSLWIKS